MPPVDTRLPRSFYLAIEEELAAHPEGLREHQLIRSLKAHGFFDFLPEPPAEPAALFRAHFLLFHALYRLRDALSGSCRGWLQIDTLCIRRLPWSAADSALATPDALRTWYLDWSNLDNTGAADVDALIDSFWRQFARFDGRADALAELGLADPVDDETIKRTWRRLAMQHHPDRGGDNTRLQAINAAVECLLG